MVIQDPGSRTAWSTPIATCLSQGGMVVFRYCGTPLGWFQPMSDLRGLARNLKVRSRYIRQVSSGIKMQRPNECLLYCMFNVQQARHEKFARAVWLHGEMVRDAMTPSSAGELAADRLFLFRKVFLKAVWTRRSLRHLLSRVSSSSSNATKILRSAKRVSNPVLNSMWGLWGERSDVVARSS